MDEFVKLVWLYLTIDNRDIEEKLEIEDKIWFWMVAEQYTNENNEWIA